MAISDLRRELVDVLDRLRELPDDAFQERIDLRNRQHELRARMAEALREERRATPDSADALRRELKQLRRRRQQLAEERTASAAGASGSGMGASSVPQFQDLRFEQTRSLGIAELDARIDELRWELQQLAGPMDDQRAH